MRESAEGALHRKVGLSASSSYRGGVVTGWPAPEDQVRCLSLKICSIFSINKTPVSIIVMHDFENEYRYMTFFCFQ